MNSSSPYISTKYDSLQQAIEGVGLTSNQQDCGLASIEFGPGNCYVIEADSKALVYLSHNPIDGLPESLIHRIEGSHGFTGLIHPDDANISTDLFAESDQAKTQALRSYRLSASEDNDWLPVRDYRFALKDNNDKTIAYLGRIMVNNRQLQEIEKAKLQAWKQVSNSSVRRFLHDFNNTIAGIYSLSELYAQEGASMESMLEGMGHIRDNSIRAQTLTKNIREITMMTTGGVTYHNIEKLIEDNQSLLLSLLPKGTELNLKLNGSTPLVQIDAVRFIKTLLHIIANCEQSASKTPIVTISCELHANTATSPTISIKIVDNGCGISSNSLERTTDAFFTTKDPEKHLGMGLHIANRFVRDQNGTIQVESIKGKGTTVTLSIPAANLNETLDSKYDASKDSPKTTLTKAKTEKPFVILIYAWEDIAQSPLLEQMREKGWKYRIHIDPYQVIADTKHLKEELDGVIVCFSGLDDNAAPLIQQLSKSHFANKTAIINMDGPIDTLPPSAQNPNGFESSNEVKAATQIKRLSKFFSQST